MLWTSSPLLTLLRSVFVPFLYREEVAKGTSSSGGWNEWLINRQVNQPEWPSRRRKSWPTVAHLPLLVSGLSSELIKYFDISREERHTRLLSEMRECVICEWWKHCDLRHQLSLPYKHHRETSSLVLWNNREPMTSPLQLNEPAGKNRADVAL